MGTLRKDANLFKAYIMHAISKELRALVPAIGTILDEHPMEDGAAPKLRALAIKHGVRRYKVFAAYRLLAQQRRADNEKPQN